jgi:ABC-type nitrate/sulfonate/bicarbonate transport system ATPase subunit
VPPAKASGFQKCLLALALRVGLARSLRFRQLFLDETFAACDSDNQALVPAFLRRLVGPAFDSVLLVTHHITDADDLAVHIQVDADGNSRIAW